MKYGRMMVAVLGLAVATAYAAQSKNNPVVEHEVAFDGCHFKVADAYGGRITGASYFANIHPNASHPFDTWIQFDCLKNAKPNEIADVSGVTKIHGRWVLAEDNVAGVNTQLYTLHGKDWDGAGITQDDQPSQSRSFVFCLVHGPQALCGWDSEVMNLAYPKESVLPQIIKLLESIEFIDPPSSSSGATPTTPPPPTTSSVQ